MALAATIALSHDGILDSCIEMDGKAIQVVKLNEVSLENGLLAETYAIQTGGGPRIITYTQLEGDSHGRLPLFIEVDVDGDHYPDLLLIRLHDTNTCADYTLYDDYNKPGEHPSPEQLPRLKAEGSNNESRQVS